MIARAQQAGPRAVPDREREIAEQPFDDADGLRDFSPDVIRRRRALGRNYASAKLQSVFPNATRGASAAAPLSADGVS